MEIDKIKEMLEYRFSLTPELPQKRHIIFWYDSKKEFRDFSVKHLGNSGLVTDQYMGMYPTNLTPYITEERRLNVA